MEFVIENKPAYAVARAKLQPGEAIRAESGAMIGMTPELQMQTSAGVGKGGMLKALGRKLFTGESFFMNTFKAANLPGEVMLAPPNIGDLVVHPLNGDVMIQSTCYLASAEQIDIQTKVGGFKSWFGGTGFFMIKASGQGPLVLSAFGAIIEMDVTEPLVVDTGHIVAFEPTLDYSIRRVGGWFSTFFSGEGFVCHFSGRGKLWLQSRNPNEFGQTVGPKLPER